MFEFRQFMPGIMIIFPIIFMAFFIIRLLLHKKRSNSSGGKLTGLSESQRPPPKVGACVRPIRAFIT